MYKESCLHLLRCFCFLRRRGAAAHIPSSALPPCNAAFSLHTKLAKALFPIILYYISLANNSLKSYLNACSTRSAHTITRHSQHKPRLWHTVKRWALQAGLPTMLAWTYDPATTYYKLCNTDVSVGCAQKPTAANQVFAAPWHRFERTRAPKK